MRCAILKGTRRFKKLALGYALLHYICVECVKDTCTFSEGFRELQSQVEDAELLDKLNYAQTHSFEQFLQQFKK